MDKHHEVNGPPRWLVITIVVAALGFVAVFLVTNAIAENNRQEAIERCEEIVEARDELREMWLALVDLFPGNENVQLLIMELDVRLPHLNCEGPNFTPVPDTIDP